tara:strand:+ start:735 stop:1394 length:660 start_codon:yes stop_codon:yes gene_type:complete
MAANEHKNLQDINLHTPKGFRGAANETVLSKGAGSSAAARDGILQWAARSTMGVTNYKMQGYTVGTANFQHGEDIADNKSPFLMDVDYGSSTVAGGSLSPADFFRIGQSFITPENANVSSIDGWVTSSGVNAIEIVICKVSPNPSSTTAITPTILAVCNTVGGENNNLLLNIKQTIIAEPLIREGDVIFAMIKESEVDEGSNIYMNLSIQTMTFTPQIT